MIGKLMKFEYRSSMRFMGVIWAAMIVTALMLGVMELVTSKAGSDFYGGGILTVISVATTMLYGLCFTALVVATIIVIVLRFYKGLLGDEGYLMHTLPVTTRQLIMSKGLVAATIVFISIAVGGLSIFIIAGLFNPQTMGQFFYAVAHIPEAVARNFGDARRFLVLVIEALVLSIGFLLIWIYKIYASLSIGQLVDKHRILLSLGAYLGFNTAFTVLFTIIGLIVGQLDIQIIEMSFDRHWFVGLQVTVFVILAIELVFILIYHFIAEQLLSKKLNLQ